MDDFGFAFYAFSFLRKLADIADIADGLVDIHSL
jgi:hypothetical protein